MNTRYLLFTLFLLAACTGQGQQAGQEFELPQTAIVADGVTLAIDPADGRLVFLSDSPSGHNFAGGAPLWRLYYNTPERKEIEIRAVDCTPSVSRCGDTLRLDYDAPGGKAFALHLKIWAQDGQARFAAELQNNEPHTIIRELQYPLIGKLQLPEGYKLLTTHTGGQIFDDPVRKIADVDTRSLYMTPAQKFRQYNLQYPRNAASNCVAFIGENDGLYFGSHDTSLQQTWHGLRVYPNTRSFVADAPQDDRKEASQDDRVWCAVSGAICNDANHISGPSRTGEGSYRALMAALGIPDQVGNDDIAFINVHGTSTLYNDEMESIAIDRAGLADVPVNTLKGYFGHTLGAAGVLETILSMAAVEDGTVLGTRGFEKLGVSRPLRLSSQNSPIEGGKQSFVKLLSGFGGVNAAMLFSRRYKETVFANRLDDSALPKIDAPKRSIDFVENSGNQIVKENASKNLLWAKHNVEITPSRVVLDGKCLQVDSKQPEAGATTVVGGALLEAIYRKYIGDWPKFFKMDPLAKLGFVASELLLQAEGGDRQPTDRRAVILFNRSGSLADDINYQRGIDGPDHLGSPSLFVYTLPNIVTGEIAIRNKYYAETSFYCIPEPDEELMLSIVEEALEPGMSAIAGWCECSSENDFNAKMYILEG